MKMRVCVCVHVRKAQHKHLHYEVYVDNTRWRRNLIV